MKFARSVSAFIGNAMPFVSDVLMRSLSIGCIMSSSCPGPTAMPKPARMAVVPWFGTHPTLTRGRMFVLTAL